jgi:hypothetical protein
MCRTDKRICTVAKLLIPNESFHEKSAVTWKIKIFTKFFQTHRFHHVHKSQLLVPNLNQLNLAHILITYFFEIQFNTVLPS